MSRESFTREWLAERNARLARAYGRGIVAAPSAPLLAAPARARGTVAAAARMNSLERAYAAHLELRVRANEVRWWAFEPLRLRLATGAGYTPDFAVVLEPGGVLEFHETKGFMREAAQVRLRVAAALYPWRFVLVRRAARGAWSFEPVSP